MWRRRRKRSHYTLGGDSVLRAQITDGRGRRQVSFDRERVVQLGAERFEGEVTEQGGAVVIAFPGRSVSVVSDWVPGEPVWHGTLDGVKVAAQVRPVLSARPCWLLCQCACLYAA